MAPTLDYTPAIILFALAGAALLGTIAWALVEVAIGLFKRRPKGLIIGGTDILQQKLHAAMKDSPSAFARTEVIHVDEPKIVGRLRPDRDRFGLFIPAEYPPEFNPAAFCWSGFFFPYLWPFQKGLVLDGIRFLVLGWGWFAIGVYFLSSYPETNTFIWLIFLALLFLPNFWCGFTGYQNYSRMLNSLSAQKIHILNFIGVFMFGFSLLLPFVLPTLISLNLH